LETTLSSSPIPVSGPLLPLADRLPKLGLEPVDQVPVFDTARCVPGSSRFLPAPERLLRLGEIAAQGAEALAAKDHFLDRSPVLRQEPNGSQNTWVHRSQPPANDDNLLAGRTEWE